MSRRIWTKPFIKYDLSGDRTVAKSLEKRARACVGYLFDQLMPNQKFRFQNWNYADGSRITAFVWRDVLGERARVEIFAPPNNDEVLIGFEVQLESGLLILTRSGWSPTLPFYVSVGSDIGSYFNGIGTVIPCSDSEQIIQGKYDIQTTLDVENEVKSGCFVFNEEPPRESNVDWPISNGKYKSHLYGKYTPVVSNFKSEMQGDTPKYSAANRYTGLMRLAVQSWVGAGKYPNYICPIGNISTNDNIYIDDVFNFWWVRITNVVSFVKMDFLPGFETLKEQLSSVDLSLDENIAPLSLLLSAMVAPKNIDVITSGDLSEVLAFGVPIAWGWHFSKGIALTEKKREASILLWRRSFEGLNPYWETKEVKVNFNFSDENPTADITEYVESAKFKIKADIACFWVPSNPFGYQQVYDFPSDDFSPYEGNTAKTYLFYDENDDIAYFKYTSPTSSTSTGSGTILTIGSVLACGGNGYYAQVWGTSGGVNIGSGGFLSPNEELSPLTFVNGSFIMTEYLWGASSADSPDPIENMYLAIDSPPGIVGAWTSDPNAGTMSNNLLCECTEQTSEYQEFLGWSTDNPKAYIIQLLSGGSGSAYKKQFTITNQRNYQILVISQWDPTAAYGCSILSVDGNYREDLYPVTLENKIMSKWVYHKATELETDEGGYRYVSAYSTRAYNMNIAFGVGGPGGCYAFDAYAGWNRVVSSIGSTPDVYDDKSRHVYASATLITASGGSFQCTGDWDDWSTFGWAGKDYTYRATVFGANLSYTNNIVYNKNPSVDIVGEPGHAGDLTPETRWMGFI